MNIFKKSLCAIAVGSGILIAGQAQAVNWLMVQGTEEPGSAPRAKLWGFLQPQYERVENNQLPTNVGNPWQGQDAAFNSIGPNLASSSQFQLRRARIGVRGAGFPLDDKINYFFLAEFGKNGITEYGSAVELTDASVTFNHIKGARVRVGQFKTPMSEEVYQGIALFDWINFTGYANQQLLERHFEIDGQAPCIQTPPPAVPGSAKYLEACTKGNEWTAFGAARDTGIQVFDTFVFDGLEDWEFSYSGMVGNGTGLNEGDYNNNKDYYLYLSAEQVYNGKRARRNGWKTFAWYQKGTREILASNGKGAAATFQEEEFDRKRWGIGTTYRKGKIRASAEYNKAEGMIFNGLTGGATPGSMGINPQNSAITLASQFNILPDEEADGWYVDFGYKIMPQLELAARYDVYNKATKNSLDVNGIGLERKYKTWTLGAQYFFNKKTRATVNYAFRNGDGKDNNTADQTLDEMGDVLSFQVTAIF